MIAEDILRNEIQEQKERLASDIDHMRDCMIPLPYVEAGPETFRFLSDAATEAAGESENVDKIRAQMLSGAVGLSLTGVLIRRYEDVPEWSLWPPRIVSVFESSGGGWRKWLMSSKNSRG